MQVYPLASVSDAQGLNITAIEVIHVIFRLEPISEERNCQEGWRWGLSGRWNTWHSPRKSEFAFRLKPSVTCHLDLVHQDRIGRMGAFACWSEGLKGRLSMPAMYTKGYLPRLVKTQRVCDKTSVCDDLGCIQVVIGSRPSSWGYMQRYQYLKHPSMMRTGTRCKLCWAGAALI